MQSRSCAARQCTQRAGETPSIGPIALFRLSGLGLQHAFRHWVYQATNNRGGASDQRSALCQGLDLWCKCRVRTGSWGETRATHRSTHLVTTNVKFDFWRLSADPNSQTGQVSIAHYPRDLLSVQRALFCELRRRTSWNCRERTRALSLLGYFSWELGDGCGERRAGHFRLYRSWADFPAVLLVWFTRP